MDKMSYTEFLEYCISEGISDDINNIQEAYEEYLNNTDSYTDLLEFFVENGIFLDNDQLNALQEKTALDKWIGNKANRYRYESKKANKISLEDYDKLSKKEKDKINNAGRIGYRTNYKYNKNFDTSWDPRQIHERKKKATEFFKNNPNQVESHPERGYQKDLKQGILRYYSHNKSDRG